MSNVEDVPPMEDIPTLKAEDFPRELATTEVEEADESGSKASSAASEDFVKVNGKDSEEEHSPAAEENLSISEPAVKSEPEEFRTNNFQEEKEPQNLLNFVDPKASANMDSDNYLKDYYEQLLSENDGFPSPGYSVQFNEASGMSSADKQQEVSAFDHFQQNSEERDKNNVSDVVPEPILVEPVQAAPQVPSNDYMSDLGASIEDGEIVTYDEDISPFYQESIDNMGNKKAITDTQPKGFDPVQLETEPKKAVMSEEQKANDIMVFDEQDDLIKLPPQTIIHDENVHDHDDVKPMQPAHNSEPESEEEEKPTIPGTVEDIEPSKPEGAPIISFDDIKTEDTKASVPPPVVEDIIQKPISTDTTKQDDEAKEDCKDPVIDLLHWRDVKQSACVLSFSLLVLGSLTFLSIISVFSYTGLALLTVTLSFRFYKLVLQTLNGTQQPHPFQHLLDYDLTISEEQVHKYADSLFKHANCTIQSARSLFLIENTVNSLKLGVCLWLLTFIGCWFNGLTLVIAALLFAFTAPPVYEKHQTQIDQYVSLANEKLSGVWDKITAKIPALKSKPKTE